MESVEMVALIAGAEEAREALAELKRLERAGWIDLIYYALVSRDVPRVEETSDPVEAAGGGSTGLAGYVLEQTGETGGLTPGRSALVVILDDRFSERISEELESRGSLVQHPLERAHRVSALRSSVSRIRAEVDWLQEYLHAEVARAKKAGTGERDQFVGTIAASRAELGVQREKLHARLRALEAAMEEDLNHTRRELEQKGAEGCRVLVERIEETEIAIADCTQKLAFSVVDHMDALAAHAAELQLKAAAASADAVAEIESQMHHLEARMRKHRAELTAAVGSSAARARRYLQDVGERAGTAERPVAREMKSLDQRHAQLKADLRRLEKEDTAVWRQFAEGVRHSLHALTGTVERVGRAGGH